MFSTQKRSDVSRDARNRRRPGLESLEGRALMSLGSEFQVNSITNNDQFSPATAGQLGGGLSVTAWVHSFSATDHDIHAQVYDKNGSPVGPELSLVTSAKDEFDPAVAMGRDGSILLSWTERESSGDTNILARKFNTSGTPLTDVVQVGVGTFREHDSSIATDFAGNFVVAYTRDTNNNNPDVFAKKYNFLGQQTAVMSAGVSSKAETAASVGMNASTGAVFVAYQVAFSPTDDDVMLSRFTASGSSLGTTVVAGSGAREQAPSLSMNLQGKAVIAYQKLIGGKFDILARRMSSNGILGTAFTVAGTSDSELNPSVSMRSNSDQFVVAYDNLRTRLGVFSRNVGVREVSSNNLIVGNFNAGTNRLQPVVTFAGTRTNAYRVSYTAISNTSFDQGLGIRARRGQVV